MYLKGARGSEGSTSEAIAKEAKNKRSFGLKWGRWRLNKKERLKDMLEVISREFDDECDCEEGNTVPSKSAIFWYAYLDELLRRR